MKLYLKLIILMLALTAGFIFCCGFSYHTVAENEKFNVKLLSSFTTYFDGENAARSDNIRLAASSVNGFVLQNGDVFSFNAIVGQRTSERGYKRAKIIENGEFVEGIGGGVCQVSTTLYNAALLAGCRIREYHPHSLAISYVPPSCHAMVSGTFFDLKFENTTGSTLYISALTGKNYVNFKFYGRDFGKRYSYSTRVTGAIEAPEEFTEDIALVREGKDGIVSEGYLTVTQNGVTKEILIRRDKYAPRKKISLKIEEPIDGELAPDISENILP